MLVEDSPINSEEVMRAMSTQRVASPLKISHTIGRREYSGLGFRFPVALAINDRLGHIYVLSRSIEVRPDAKHVTVCTTDEEYLGQFGDGGSNDGQFTWPSSIGIDKDDNIYVSDEWLNRISIFSKEGEFLGKWGTEGSGDGEINRPSGLAFDRDDNMLVVDASNNRVQKFTKDGRFLAQWGSAGSGDGQFNLPWGIEVDSNGDIYIADWRNDRIQKFSPDGTFLMKFGRSGKEDGQFNRPTGVAVDKNGDIYIADYRNERVQMFDSRGDHITTFLGEAGISKWAKAKLDSNEYMWREREVAYRLGREKLFHWPIAVDVDAEGRIFVLERGRHRIQVYTKG